MTAQGISNLGPDALSERGDQTIAPETRGGFGELPAGRSFVAVGLNPSARAEYVIRRPGV